MAVAVLRRGLARPRTFVAAGVAVFAAVAVAGTAFACTIIMGQLTLAPTSGPIGSTVTTSASGLKVAPATYRLLFNSATRMSKNQNCMTSTKVLASSVATDGSGGWSNVTVTIPPKSPRGVSEICGMENTPVKNQTGTMHEVFTVT